MRGYFTRLFRTKRMRAAFVLIPLALIFIGGGVYAGLGGTIRPSTSSDIELQKGLVAHLKFDGNAKDSTPYGNNGVVSGAASAVDRKGKSGGAYSFNGSSDYIVVTSNQLRNAHNGGEFTYGLWYSATNYGALITRGAGNLCEYDPVITRDTTKLSGCAGSGNVASGLSTAGTGWNHILFSVSTTADEVKTYVNGILVDSKTLSSIKATSDRSAVIAASATQNTLYIGAQQTNAGSGSLYNYLAGSIDDVRIYSRALSSSEVSGLYKQYDTSIKTNAGQKGLVGYWKLDGNPKDSTPNGSDGTATSVTSVVDRKGVAGSAYAFAGTASSCVQLPSAPVLNSSVFTFSAWVNPSIVSIHTIIGSGNASNPQFRIEGSGALTLLKQNVVQFPSSTGTVPVNSWSHVAITYSAAGDYVYYINGAPAGSGTNLQTFGFSAYRIGCKTTSEHFSGSIDDVRIYKRVLSASELAEQFKSSGSQINLQTTPTSGIANLNSGLRAYWPLNGNTKDATPYGNNGIVNNVSAAADRNGRANSAYRFTGSPSNSVITVVSNSAQDITGDVTVSAWIKPLAAQIEYARIIHKYNGATYINYMLAYDLSSTQKMRFIIDLDSGSRKILTSGTAINNTNKWYHVVGVRSGSTMSLYIDGVLEASDGAVTGNNRLAPASDLYIGGGAGNSFNGDIDDVRLYSRAFSAADVAALYGKYY